MVRVFKNCIILILISVFVNIDSSQSFLSQRRRRYASQQQPLSTTSCTNYGLTVSTKLKSPSPRVSILLAANNNANDELERRIQSFLGDDESVERVVVRGSDTDDIDGAIWEDLETGKPPEIMVMKELLGINIFTYILAALIIFFLGMNIIVGPGWLGSALGIPGTGSINEISDSIPDTVDLSSSEYLL